MDLSPADVRDLVAEYEAEEPLAAVEADHVKILPRTFESGEYGWRDAKWVVRWYYRRFLGTVPNADRRAAEAAFDENTYEDVQRAVTGAAEARSLEPKLDLLTEMTGVDVPVASAFLQYLHPGEYVATSAREWAVLRQAGEVDGAYPEEMSVGDYEAYLDACRAVAQRCDCDLWTVYRAVWMGWAETELD